MIAVASDHAAYGLKEHIIKHLKNEGFKIVDCGVYDAISSADYPDYAALACKKVTDGSCNLAILVCGTGVGMSMAANKIKGIRCALCSDTYSARLTREHNDANVLALGERVVGRGLAIDIVEAFVRTEFSADKRHIARIEKISKLEMEEI